MVAARCLLDYSPTLSAPLPAPVYQVFLHRPLLKILPAVPDVRVASADGAGTAPAAPAEAYLRELVDVNWGDVFPALAVAAEQLPLGGVVDPAARHELDHVGREILQDLGALDIHHPGAAPRGPALAVLTAVAYELREAIPAVAVGAGCNLFGGVAADDAIDD